MIVEEVPLFGLVFVNHGSVCHGDWFCLHYIFFFRLFAKSLSCKHARILMLMFAICHQVCCTTDSGSNCVKAFSVFGQHAVEPDTALDINRSAEDAIEFADVGSLLAADDHTEYRLPAHQR